MEQIFHDALVLFITAYGFALILKGANIIKTSPGRILGNMIRATIKGVWWLLKGTVWLVGIFIREAVELVGGIVAGLPSPKTTTSNSAYGTASFLTGRARRRLLSPRKRGPCIDGRNHIVPTLGYKNIFICAPSGAGKSTIFTIVNLLRRRAAH